MAVDFDFSDVDDAFDQFDQEVKEVMTEAGEIGVQYAKDQGDYQDITGTLRNSNKYEIEEDGLAIKNEAEYASFVEANGYEVASGGVLEAWKFLNDKTR